jgi:predicted TIM-barrel fold metal-dependent hydrolase
MGKNLCLSPTDATAKALAGLSDIAHVYLVYVYVRDSRRHPIVATVHIEALWAGDPVGETRWLETLDKSRGIASRYVGAAPFGTPEAAAIIAARAAFGRMPGLRSILSWHADPEHGRTPAWRRDVALLPEHGLNLELMIYPRQADIVVEIARALPGLQIIINHCGSPIDRDAAGMQRWRESIAQIVGNEIVMGNLREAGERLGSRVGRGKPGVLAHRQIPHVMVRVDDRS